MAVYHHLINGFVPKSDTKNTALNFEILNDYSSGFADIEVNQEYLFPPNIEIDKYQKIGYTIGCEFFMDGNDTYLLYDDSSNRVICINHYS